jgi:DNA (cytosine-5)-methyltransferase 1
LDAMPRMRQFCVQHPQGSRARLRVSRLGDDGRERHQSLRRPGHDSGLGDASGKGLPLRERAQLSGENGDEEGRAVSEPSRSFWSLADWLLCRDGKARPVEPGTFPLAHGIPGRVGRLRAYGNAIVPQVAAEVLKAIS